jgi:hypothetical protein
MGSCTDLVSRAEFEAFKASLGQKYIPQTEKASIYGNALNISQQLIQGAAAVQGARIATALENSKKAREVAESAGRSSKAANDAARAAKAAANTAAANTAATANTALAVAQSAKAQAAAAARAATSVLALLTGILIAIASFALIQLQLRATQARIDAQERAMDAFNADYTRLINLVSQNRITVEANNAAIEANNAIVRNNQNAIATTNSLVLDAQSTNRSLASDLNSANQRINSLISELNAVNSKANSATSIAAAASNKLPPVLVIKDLSQVQNLSAENNRLRRQLELQQSDLNGYRVALNNFQARLPTQEDKLITRKVREQAITNASGIRDLNGQYIGIPSKIGQTVKSEFSNNIQTFKQDAQKQIEQTIKNAGFTQFDIKQVSKEFDAKIAKITTDFNERLRGEISTIPKIQPVEVKQIVKTEVNSQIQGITKVNNQQATEINSKLDTLNSKLPDPLTLAGIATVVGGLDILRQIKNKPIPTPFCLAPALVPPVGAQAKRNGGAIAGLQGVTIVQNGFTQKAVKAVSETTTKIDKIVTHKDYGLQKIQKFADTAWKATHADKILNALSTAMVIHNGIMLSKNLAQTVGEAASVTLQAMGVKDSEGQPFDVGSALSGKLKQLITSAIGAEGYEALTIRIANYSRIYQSAANLTNTAFSLFDSARNIAETTAANTGKIGNALRESGAVYEDAYTEMLEKVNPQNAAMRKLEGFSNGLEAIEQGVSSISSVSSEVVSIKDNYTQLKSEKEALAQETTEILAAKKVEKGEAKVAVQVSAEVKAIDFTKDET